MQFSRQAFCHCHSLTGRAASVCPALLPLRQKKSQRRDVGKDAYGRAAISKQKQVTTFAVHLLRQSRGGGREPSPPFGLEVQALLCQRDVVRCWKAKSTEMPQFPLPSGLFVYYSLISSSSPPSFSSQFCTSRTAFPCFSSIIMLTGWLWKQGALPAKGRTASPG